MKCSIKIAGFVSIAAAAGICWAQVAVQSQANPRVAGTGADASVRYSGGTSQMMPSEIRQAAWDSGMLPSEIRSNYIALGPMTPQGQAAYFQKPGDSGAPSNQMDSRSDMLVRPPMPVTPSPSAPSAGSIRYSNSAPSSAVSPVTSGASNPVGSVRYDSRAW